MEIELLNFGVYGYFILMAFIFTFANCIVLFFITSKELSEKEKLFLDEFKQPASVKIKVATQKRHTKAVLSGDSIF